MTQVEQMINGTYRKLGYYDTQADNLTWMNREQWAKNKVSDRGGIGIVRVKNGCWKGK